MGGSGSSSRRKMSDVMALMAARPFGDSKQDAGVTIFVTHSLKRRRAKFCRDPPAQSPPLKRPRTTWGKPHANLSAFRCPLHVIKQEPPSFPAAATVPINSRPESPELTKAEFSNAFFMCCRFSEDDDSPLHQVPTFFPNEHLLLNPRCEMEYRPLLCNADSSSEAILHRPSLKMELSTSADVDYQVCIKEEDLDYDGMLTSDRFNEIVRDMHAILGELDSFHGSYPLVMIAREVVDGESGDSQSDLATPDTQSTSSCSSAEVALVIDDEYRIDLTDFQPDPADHVHVEDNNEGEKLPISNASGIALNLNYLDVLDAWRDRGSVLADGSWDRTALKCVQLDLSAWESEGGNVLNMEGIGRMIMLAPDSSACEESLPSTRGCRVAEMLSPGRQARVLRYREKRQTRLFCKKIRYEVRKLNAERRPRMKGRFIKRT